ncbi:MAG: recombination protein RecR [Spirochaetales bacterium]|nr:recombination protein RecR [Spirochaetales bacterium]
MTILERLINRLSKLPGLGRKSASRIAFYLLKAEKSYADALSHDIRELKERIRPCSRCGNYTETDPCSICTDSGRNQSVICVVEQANDLLAIESMHEYSGVYHVLGGAISPIDGIGPQDLTIDNLMKRIEGQTISEIIIATNPTVEGETTAMYCANLLKEKGIKITRPALGLPLGGDLEYTDSITLARAFKGRNEFG